MNSSDFSEKLLALIAEARQAGLDDDELADLLDDTANMLQDGTSDIQAALRDQP